MTATPPSSMSIASSIVSGANSASSPSSSASIRKSSSVGLSGGAIAGIVIGVVLGLALLFLAMCFFGRRRKTRRLNALRHEQSRSESLEKLGIHNQAYTLQEMRGATDQPRHEIPGQHFFEAASRERVKM
jgi:hypothetical protein